MSSKVKSMEKDFKQQLQKKLSPLAYQVCVERHTEPSFTDTKDIPQVLTNYHCICCDSLLFSSKTKYHSGSGWPSFTQPAHTKAVQFHHDNSHQMSRIEVCCANCNAHLGHVFDDGPEPTGMRYCINSVALLAKIPDE